ncbi:MULTISPECIES: caspase family protein [Paraburkholderia]|uniref:caspase family protein n=1 Tax=Paraburkholderia TaxID=1822464 RepID=UPI003B7AC5CF
MSHDSNKLVGHGRRVLLCVGCDRYENLATLHAAESDASAAFAIFTDPAFGAYPAADARLLLSPSVADVHIALTELFLDRDPADTFTFVFAGHGGVVRGTYYLALRESRLDMMSTSALPLSMLFQIINEMRPAQCNLIMDSCQSGGLVSDLGVLLKPEVIGDAQTSGISIFASSAANQDAEENESGGLGLRALLDVIAGREVIDTRRPFLDLVDAGRRASESVASDALQVPVVWGANLYGQSRFVRNPHFDARNAPAIHDVTGIIPGVGAGRAIAQAAERLWRLYYSEPSDLTPVKIAGALRTVVECISDDRDAIAQFVQGVCSTLVERGRTSQNSFAAVETIATCISVLLSAAGDDSPVDDAIRMLADGLCDELEIALEAALDTQETDVASLATGGLADFFYLPSRLTRILGWSGALVHIRRARHQDDARAVRVFEALGRRLIDDYAPVLCGMSDSEAPYLLTFAHAALEQGLEELLEIPLGILFNRIVQHQARLAVATLGQEDALAYLRARSTGDFSAAGALIARPLESLALALLVGARCGLADEFDSCLRQLDHVALNIFIPDSYRDFGKDVIREGRNHVFQIGTNVWQASDLERHWEGACLARLRSDASLRSGTVRIAAICSALVFPDRSPWFLLAPQEVESKRGS